MAEPTQTAAHYVPPPPGDTLGHPRALWQLVHSEFWERFSYYGMRALLAVYVATHVLRAAARGRGQGAGGADLRRLHRADLRHRHLRRLHRRPLHRLPARRS